ncbi:MAG: N-acetylneuraminate synthase family protein, partial [Bacteroidales bacterium]|nr:N-acetylneuraminate synthase family protein [Bacteroidales bacterium]
VELSLKNWLTVFDHSKDIDLKIIPCVLDEPSLEFSVKYGFQLIKIHATDLLNVPFLKRIAELDIKVLLETQCATKRDINIAIEILGDKIEAIFHGFSNYPTEYEDLSLNALDFIKNEWPEFKIGFADHSLDTTEIPLMALAKGVDYLEKHITLSRNNRNYDWQVSLEPDEFKILVNQVNKYKNALSNFFKQPVPSELPYRHVMYKKYIEKNGTIEVKRSENGLDYYDFRASKHDKNKVIATIIARLKSKRLPLKVFQEFHNDLLIFDLISRVSTSKRVDKVILASSFLEEDKELLEETKKRNLNTYAGDPLSVIDRMIDLAEQEKAGAVFRITGDNPFTDPFLLDQMVDLYIKNDLEYVRANNLPFGVTAELFSIQYLYRLYYSLENPYQTEYLTWFVMLDEKSRKGCIDFLYEFPDIKRVGYSVDYTEDLERCKKLLSKINKNLFQDVSLKDIVTNTELADLIELDGAIKLPEGKSITFREYFQRLHDMKYIIRKEVTIEDLP